MKSQRPIRGDSLIDDGLDNAGGILNKIAPTVLEIGITIVSTTGPTPFMTVYNIASMPAAAEPRPRQGQQ